MRRVLHPYYLVVVLSPCVTVAGPIWDEIAHGDAGSLPSTAQEVTGVANTPVTKIIGELTGLPIIGVPDFEDVFVIRIPDSCGDPQATFEARTTSVNGGANDFDTQLWLFRAGGANDGLGLLGNDDFGPGIIQSRVAFPSTDGTMIEFPGEGLFYLAISGFDNDPRSALGPVFDQDSFTEISGPDGNGGGLPFEDWDGIGAVGAYEIDLSCVTVVPEPATALLVLLCWAGWRRRR